MSRPDRQETRRRPSARGRSRPGRRELAAPVTALVLAVLALAAAGAWPRDESDELNAEARRALEAGAPSRAVVLLEQALALDPGDEVLARNLAWGLHQRGVARLADFDVAGALEDQLRASRLHPEQIGYALHAAAIHLRRYELAPCQDILERALARDPDHIEALVMLGDVHDLAGRPDQAVETYEQAVRVHGDGHPAEGADLAAAARRGIERVRRQRAVEADYETTTTDTFVVRSPPGTRLLRLLDVLERARAEVCSDLSLWPPGRTPVVLHPPEAFREATGAHDWVGGLFDRRIRLPIADPDRDRAVIEAAFRHELTHLLVSGLAPRCPTWINEGLAQMMEHGTGTGVDRLATHLDATGRDREAGLPRLAELPERFVGIAEREVVVRSYLTSYAFVDHVATQHGLGRVVDWIAGLAAAPADEAFARAVGRELEDEERLFREMVRTARR